MKKRDRDFQVTETEIADVLKLAQYFGLDIDRDRAIELCIERHEQAAARNENEQTNSTNVEGEEV